VGLILDTSVVIAAERGALDMQALLNSVGDEPVAIAAVSASELLCGCHRATTAALRTRRLAWVEAVLQRLPAISFGLAEARAHAELWAHLAQRGRMIGPHDLIIGATAVANGYRLATLNTREFRRVPGLSVLPLQHFKS
jgi:predicted nucleic acid-binding protein